MATPAFQVGQRITTGSLLRYIPNWETHWDGLIHRPKSRAFRRRKSEKSISMFLEGPRPAEKDRCETSVDRLEIAFPEFAICRVDIEMLLVGTPAWIEYRPLTPEEHPEWQAHFEILNLPKGRSAQLADTLAEIAKPPATIRMPSDPRSADESE